VFRSEEQGGKIKPAGYQTPYTEEQKYELIVRCPKDPIHFITKYCWIISTKGGQMLFNLYDYQKQLILHYLNHEKTITLLSRQVGKCCFYRTLICINGNKQMIGDLFNLSWKHRCISKLENVLVILARYAKKL
jgi:hypothetical protein